jgi:hypothetical protein
MMQSQTYELKAVVVVGDILETGASVTQDKCLTVQRFNYTCQRKRDHTGKAYGPTDPVFMNFAIRVNSPEQAKPFYQNMVSTAHYPISFLFNASFNATFRLSDYADAMVVDGYVVEVEDNFNSGDPDMEETDQMILDVKLQVRSITYLGKGNNKVMTFIK